MNIYTIRTVVAVFNCLHLLGLSLLLVVLVPALFSVRIHRMRTWHAMIISGIIYNLCYMPLMILGQQTGQPPSAGLCIFQSSLIYAAPVLLVSSSLAFLLEVFFVLSHAIYGSALVSSTCTHILLLAVPSFFYMMVFSMTLLIGLQQRESIERDEWSLYCHSTASSPTFIAAIFVLIATLTMIILAVYMAFVLWNTKKRLKSIGADDNLSSIFPPNLFFRFLAFSTCILLAIGLSASILPFPTSYWPFWKMTLTTPPIVIALSFGIQKDMIAFYWRRKRRNRVDSVRLT
ncbi:hypothetical protein ARMGADRAFT_753570 [Armillaria gallica]|uniref:G-protein coupled receptors family 1 profile domain-containing protein n=1 Tax=Armillaria gallica TaxID=47427 RepID=A0A2H3E5T2_ARMGA|nr:hypothetical protein ARMGADRAFT_753570 [Armillaria gallica]